jgi:opacity protein-like surface antigen
MFWRKLSLLVVLWICFASSAFAQGRFEVTPFFGSRFGGVIDVNTLDNDFLTIKSSENYGVMGDVSLWGPVQGEFMWNRQPTSLTAHNVADDTYTFLTNAKLDMYQFSLLYQFRDPDAKLRPFMVAGLGFTHFDTHQVLDFSNRFSYNLGLGVKYYLIRNLGLRLDARWSPSHTTQSNVIFCDFFFGCFPTTITNRAEQGQVNAGVIFRF